LVVPAATASADDFADTALGIQQVISFDGHR